MHWPTVAQDILIESQLLDQSLPDLGGAPLDYEKYDLENLSLQDALNGITDFDSTDAIFAERDVAGGAEERVDRNSRAGQLRYPAGCSSTPFSQI